MIISRRHALTGATAAVVVAGASVAIHGKSQDPTVEIGRRVTAARNRLNDCPADATERHYKMLVASYDALQMQLLSTPAESFAGVLAKVRYIVDELVVFLNEIPIDKRPYDDLDWEHKSIVSTLRDLERLAGEALSGTIRRHRR